MIHFAIHFLLSLFIHGAGVSDQSSQLSNESKTTITEVEIRTAVFMEGAFDMDLEKMHTRLHDKGYLPGQKPKTFFGKAIKAGQPYKSSPWHHDGDEGVIALKTNYLYPEGTVDWVLISLRKNNESLQTIYQGSALLMEDGRIVFDNRAAPCVVDVNESYFIVIEHRNHLGVISHRPVSVVDGTLSYDFRDLGPYSSKVSGLKSINDEFGVMMAGNGDQSSNPLTSFSIDEDDLKLWRLQNGQNSSYFTMDLDLNGDVSVKDQELLFNNYGITSAVPLFETRK